MYEALINAAQESSPPGIYQSLRTQLCERLQHDILSKMSQVLGPEDERLAVASSCSVAYLRDQITLCYYVQRNDG